MIFENLIIRGNEGNYANYNFDRSYNIVKVTFDKNNIYDFNLLQQIYNKGIGLSKLVCANAANEGNRVRNERTLEINAISGTLAEYAWKEYINYRAGRNIVDFTNYVDPREQIDLQIINTDIKIEVRSSFVRNGLQFALCNQRHRFDVLGPYTNIYKPNETFKDFYVRVLYPFDSDNFYTFFNGQKVEVYLTCGATLAMMQNINIYVNKDLTPAEALIDVESNYRVIPFERSLDTIEITQNILNRI